MLSAVDSQTGRLWLAQRCRKLGVLMVDHTLNLVKAWFNARAKGSSLLLVSPERYRKLLDRGQRSQENGKPWLNNYIVNNVLRDVRSHAKRVGMKLDGVLTVHAFRKSCGQNWANHLPMNVVKEFMGHSDIKTTAEFYTTVSNDHAEHARRVIQTITVGPAETNKTDARLTPEAQKAFSRKAG